MRVMNPHCTLPVDAILPEMTDLLRRHPNLVIEAPPGAGKTTRVPPALLSTVAGEIIVLEPRRIAARMAARRVAYEMGEKAGETTGYQVRFEEAVGPRTRLRFVTEGVLTRRLLTDPLLRGVDVVVLDEFHERHMEGDLALALLLRLQRQRPELKLIVMSATLDATPVARHLGDCPVLRSEGRLFPLAITHLRYSPKPLEKQVRDAVEQLLREGHTGDTLIFLPGAFEIHRAMRECAEAAKRAGAMMLPLHGSLTAQEQERAVTPAKQQKLVFSTNVAESSVTVEGVTAVIDSGLARVAAHSPWSGLPTLEVCRVSKASAKQRAGRAGRTSPGCVLRLYTEEDYAMRAEQDEPEIKRMELSQLCLTLRAMGIKNSGELRWLDAPPSAAIEAAEALLERLGAVGKMAQKMARYPLPPRLSRILVESMERGMGESGCLAAALLGSGIQTLRSDLLAAMESADDPRLRQHVAQLRRIARPRKQQRHDDDALLISVLAGFPDRVARRRSGNQLLLSSGSSAEMKGEAPHYEFMTAVDAEDRREKTLPLVRMASRIEPEWLIDLFPSRVREQTTLTWNHTAERVESVSALLYDDLVLHESRSPVPDAAAAAALLAQKALEAGLERFVDETALHEFMARVEFAGLPTPDLSQELCTLCDGLRSFAELKNASAKFIPMLEQKTCARRLIELAPSKVLLKNGRPTKVHYEHGKPPWIASRLQDFLGMHETPRIGPASTPVVIHLLAPNQRAVQTTSDLAGFWERLYPQVRRELMRRYPKHSWPEKP